MGQEIIAIGDIRRLYVTKEGLPKKELLLSRDDVMEKVGVYVPQDDMQSAHVRNRTSIALSQTGKYFKGHNCNWVTPKIGKRVYYGFTKNEDYMDNSELRFRARSNIARRLHAQHATLIDGQKSGLLTITRVLEIE